MGPMAINKVEGVISGGLSDNVMPLKPSPANPQMMQLVEMFLTLGQAAIQAPDVLSGVPGKSGETYQGLATRVEQATKQLSVTTRIFAGFVEQLLRNNARLNSLFMDDQEIFLVNNHEQGIQLETIDRKLYQRDFSVQIRSDMRYTSHAQKVIDAERVLTTIMQMPMLQQNLQFVHQAIKEYLEALGKTDLINYLGNAPMQPPGPPGPGAEQ